MQSTRPRPLTRRRIVGGVVVGALVWLAVWIADEVAERETLRTDRSILETIHRFSSPALVDLARFFSALGPPVFWTLVAIAATVFLWRAGRRPAALGLAAGAALTALANELLKLTFARARPDLWPRPPISGDSFPSGHAMQCAMLYGTLAVLAARRWPRARVPIVVSATLLILAIAASRAVLGVHWPTDLVAGLAIGTVCGALTLWSIDALERRAAARDAGFGGRRERPPTVTAG